MALAFQFLGPPQLILEDEPVNVNRRSIVALLSYLAVNDSRQTKRVYSRELLSALLWPDYDQVKAFTNLRHTLWEIQKTFGSNWLIANRQTIGLQANANLWVDVHRFESLLSEGQAQNDVLLRIPLLRESVNLYRHHFLTGFNLKNSSTFEEWSLAKTDELRHKLRDVLTLLTEDYCLLGDAESALPYVRRLVTLDPLNESAHRLLMQVYIQVGQHNAALKQYQRFELILRKELGIDPPPEMRALYKQIRKGEIKHTLVGIKKESIPPQRNLPQQFTSFIGRKKEQSEVIQLITRHRLVTLTGAGGVGKTRLSIKVGEQLLENYQDGVWLVELAPILDPLLVPRTTAIAIGLRDEPKQSVVDMLSDYLREKQVLLILDNCEHLLDSCAQLADTLLKRCPALEVLATSREVFGMLGEAVYHVPSLELPDIEQLLEKFRDYESVRLFEERAQLAQTDFSITVENAASVAKICNQLDGIPLAIELAAARVGTFSTEQIAARLHVSFDLLITGNRTALPRHQTLQGAIDWSYDLLSPAEKTVFQRLSVFVDGWTLDSAESICSDLRIRSEMILVLLTQLINKSLVVVHKANGKTRYRMLEHLRQYAKEKLIQAGEGEALGDRHFEYFLRLAKKAEPYLIQTEQIEWLYLLDADYDNLRTAFEYALSKEKVDSALDFCTALGWFWIIRCYWSEGLSWLTRALAKQEQDRNRDGKIARTRALYTSAMLEWQLGNIEQMQTHAEASFALASENSNQKNIAIAAYFLASALIQHGIDYKAFSMLQECMTKFQELNEPFWLARTFTSLADLLPTLGQLNFHDGILKRLQLARDAGERLILADSLSEYATLLYRMGWIDKAMEQAEESEMLYKLIGSEKTSLNSFLFAEIAWSNGDIQKSRALFMELYQRFSCLGEKGFKSNALGKLGILAMEEGDLQTARTYLDEALTIEREAGWMPWVAYYLIELGNLFYLKGDLEQFKKNFRESIFFKNYFPEYHKSYILMTMAGSLYFQRPTSSTQLLGAINNHRGDYDYPRTPMDKRYCIRAEAHARKLLGNAAFEIEFAAGQKLSLDEALDLALKTAEGIEEENSSRD